MCLLFVIYLALAGALALILNLRLALPLALALALVVALALASAFAEEAVRVEVARQLGGRDRLDRCAHHRTIWRGLRQQDQDPLQLLLRVSRKAIPTPAPLSPPHARCNEGKARRVEETMSGNQKGSET